MGGLDCGFMNCPACVAGIWRKHVSTGDPNSPVFNRANTMPSCRQGACPALTCKYSVGSLEVLGFKRIRIPPFKEINSLMADPKHTSAGFKQN